MPEELKTEDTSVYGTVKGIQRHPLFAKLKKKQKQFLLAYLQNGCDHLAATREVHKVNTPNSTRVQACRHMTDTNIRQLIIVYLGFAPQPRLSVSKKKLIRILTERLYDPALNPNQLIRLSELILEVADWKRDRRRLLDTTFSPPQAPEHEKPEQTGPTIDEQVLLLEEEMKKGRNTP